MPAVTTPTQHRITLPYFPRLWKYSIPVILFGAYELYSLGYPIWAFVLIVFCFLIISMNYVTIVDHSKKIVEDYLTIFWIPFDKDVKKYNAIDRIILTKGKFVKKLESRISSRTVNWEDYTGTLLFDDNTTLELITHDDPQKLIESVRVIASMLNVGIEDRTRREFRWVH